MLNIEPGMWGLLGVVTGGLITTGASYFLESSRERRESASLAAAFKGELRAIQQIVTRRKYIETLREIVEYIDTTGNDFPALGVRIEQEYFGVYKANVSKIGKLPSPLPERIATFYAMTFALLEDFKIASTGLPPNSSTDDQKRFYGDMITLLEDNAKAADEIVAIIGAKYG